MQPQTAAAIIVAVCIILTVLMYRLGVTAGALAATHGVPHRAADAFSSRND
jgi:hypothetical protein